MLIDPGMWCVPLGILGFKYFAQGHFSMPTTARKPIQWRGHPLLDLPSTTSIGDSSFLSWFLCALSFMGGLAQRMYEPWCPVFLMSTGEGGEGWERNPHRTLSLCCLLHY